MTHYLISVIIQMYGCTKIILERSIQMERFEEAKKEWSEPQMTQLGVKQTETGSQQWYAETVYAQNGLPATHS